MEQLYREHWPLVCGYLLRRTRDPHLAEDLAQETFVKATRALLGWRGESPVAWLLSIARNVLVDHLRRSRTELPLPDPDELGLGEAVTDAVAVRDVLGRLPERQRRLLTLVYFDARLLRPAAQRVSGESGLRGTAEGHPDHVGADHGAQPHGPAPERDVQ
ncbi:RNA polymerase sigma factor [Streptosporangium sp. CA-135522]|uniref:RNA polymerase sigma factor n=1 Tax=Streptosporangium sp. CA-135522 TaxID=3240072 RepID=UPI003D8E3DB0